MASPPLIDSFGRVHDNLRVSVTDRCNIRCFYCMPETGVQFVPRAEILDFEEIERFVRIAAGLGITKVRVTGGEPLVRRDLPVLIRRLAAIPGHRATWRSPPTACCSASWPARSMRPACGASTSTWTRSTASASSASPGATSWTASWRAWKRPSALGFSTIKINAVAVKGLVEPDIVPLARFARENGFEARFIEFMPLDAQDLWDRSQGAAGGRDHRHALARDRPARSRSRSATRARPPPNTRYADGGGRVGFIASVSRPFCLNCNRIRLTADGKLRYCLFAIEEDDVKALLRGGASDEEIAALIRRNVRAQVGGPRDQLRAFRRPAPAHVLHRRVTRARAPPACHLACVEAASVVSFGLPGLRCNPGRKGYSCLRRGTSWDAARSYEGRRARRARRDWAFGRMRRWKRFRKTPTPTRNHRT